MRLDLFSRGDSVLLLGDGNFSFSVSLHKHQLPIKITATCFESEIHLAHQLENFEYLKASEVPVFLNVDATKLHENVHLSDTKFSKIIFNFPHVGGKMKIHLNRQLLREVFESCSKMVAENGAVIISLCQGQGGTPFDRPQRRWDDSWQVTEMAAHGDFILTAVEPFLRENFEEYKCVGYRSQDVRFNLDGALVHVFIKRKLPHTCLSEDSLVRRFELVPLIENSKTLVPFIYSELYGRNPLLNQHSCICFLKDLLIRQAPEREWRILNEDEIPVHVGGEDGVPCEVNSVKCSLRHNANDTLRFIFEMLAKDEMKNKLTLYPGMYFVHDLKDFKTSAPITYRFIIVGSSVSTVIDRFLKTLIQMFGEIDSTDLSCQSEYEDSVNWFCEDTKTGNSFLAVRTYAMDCEAAIINAQKICEHFFQVGWREIWAQEHEVKYVGKPTLTQISLHPISYKFDLTLRYNEPFAEKDFQNILLLAGDQLIEGFEIVNEYTSAEGWSSKCYRLTYRSLNKSLHKRRALSFHTNIVARMMELGLNVLIG